MALSQRSAVSRCRTSAFSFTTTTAAAATTTHPLEEPMHQTHTCAQESILISFQTQQWKVRLTAITQHTVFWLRSTTTQLPRCNAAETSECFKTVFKGVVFWKKLTANIFWQSESEMKCKKVQKELCSNSQLWGNRPSMMSQRATCPTLWDSVIVTPACFSAYLFCSHGLKHLLQQDPHLLDVVHQHARLREDQQQQHQQQQQLQQ